MALSFHICHSFYRSSCGNLTVDSVGAVQGLVQSPAKDLAKSTCTVNNNSTIAPRHADTFFASRAPTLALVLAQVFFHGESSSVAHNNIYCHFKSFET